MRVTVHRSETLDAGALAVVRAAGVGPLLRRSGEALGVPARAGTRRAPDRRRRAAPAQPRPCRAPTPPPTSSPSPVRGAARARVGDVAISVERARAQNPARPADELRLLAIHGLLHCLGHDHDLAHRAARMTEATRALLPDVEFRTGTRAAGLRRFTPAPPRPADGPAPRCGSPLRRSRWPASSSVWATPGGSTPTPGTMPAGWSLTRWSVAAGSAGRGARGRPGCARAPRRRRGGLARPRRS